MARAPITSLIPPPLATDARVRALVEAFGACMDEMEDWALILLSIETAPDATLPALAYEHSLSEFVGPEGLPVDAVRTLVARAWDLHEPKGYAEGVEGGVAMLGYPAELTQWWQETPPAARGTHRIEVRLDQPLIPGQPPASSGSVRAIWRMIAAMQRWSQDHALRLASEAPVTTRVGAGVTLAQWIRVEPFDPGIPEVSTGITAAVGVTVARKLLISGWVD